MDRSLKDTIKFLDDTNTMDDSRASDIAHQLKFSEVLDLVSAIKSNDVNKAKELLVKYDDRFARAPAETEESITNEYSSIPSIKPISSKSPTVSSQNNRPGQPSAEDEENAGDELNAVMTDPGTKNRPEVRQIQDLLKRMKR